MPFQRKIAAAALQREVVALSLIFVVAAICQRLTHYFVRAGEK